MHLNDPGRLICPNVEGARCPSTTCPGATDSGVCSHLGALASWRTMTVADQVARLGGPRSAIDPAVLAAVNGCVWRGPTLPISMQDDCGCHGKELTECRAGQGKIAGRVTLRDCLDCRAT